MSGRARPAEHLDEAHRDAEFAEAADEIERAKQDRLAPVAEKALTRRSPPREPPDDYFVRAALQA